jgi:pyruvate kinase
MMVRIIREAEGANPNPLTPEHRRHKQYSMPEIICESMAHAARDLNIRAIAIFTETANTARILSKYRPAADIYGFTFSEAVHNRMNALWGVMPIRCPAELTVEAMAHFAEDQLRGLGALSPGDVFGLVAGTQRVGGATNFMRLIAVQPKVE